MRAKFILEKFEEDSDPVEDLGIGIKDEIKKWIDKQPSWHEAKNKDINNVEDRAIIVHSIIKDYSLDKTSAKSFIKYLSYSFPANEKLKLSLYLCDIDLFKSAIKDGAKLRTLNGIFKFQWNFEKERKQLLNYLRDLDHKDELKHIVYPGYLERIDDILYLETPRESAKGYPPGYKMYRVLKYIDENNITLRAHLQKLAYELSYGPNTFHPIKNKGYWGDAFAYVINNRVFKDTHGIYRLNYAGIRALERLKKQFEDKEIDALV